jgi:hypothetical protein
MRNVLGKGWVCCCTMPPPRRCNSPRLPRLPDPWPWAPSSPWPIDPGCPAAHLLPEAGRSPRRSSPPWHRHQPAARQGPGRSPWFQGPPCQSHCPPRPTTQRPVCPRGHDVPSMGGAACCGRGPTCDMGFCAAGAPRVASGPSLTRMPPPVDAPLRACPCCPPLALGTPLAAALWPGQPGSPPAARSRAAALSVISAMLPVPAGSWPAAWQVAAVPGPALSIPLPPSPTTHRPGCPKGARHALNGEGGVLWQGADMLHGPSCCRGHGVGLWPLGATNATPPVDAPLRARPVCPTPAAEQPLRRGPSTRAASRLLPGAGPAPP